MSVIRVILQRPTVFIRNDDHLKSCNVSHRHKTTRKKRKCDAMF